MNPTMKEFRFPLGQVFQLAQGDLTLETVDAIVNAANSHLAHGAGVAGAIVRKGGPQIQAESSQWVREHGPVSYDRPAYTHAGNLSCQYVIHAVGPVWGEGDEESKLRAAILGSLTLADELNLASIAFPAISTGIFGFPLVLAAQVFISAIYGYYPLNPASGLQLIRLVLFDRESVKTFLDVWEQDDHLRA